MDIMRRLSSHLSRAALLLLLLGLPIFGLWPAANAQDRAKSKQTFEYRVINISYEEFKNTAQWKKIVASQSNNEKLSIAPFHQLILNTLSKEGWELVQVVPKENADSIFYLKRTL
jgi:hypothetical protein